MSSRGQTRLKSREEPSRREWLEDEEQDEEDLLHWTVPTASRGGAQIASGSRGMLGKVLEKMHGGEVLSQHEVSAAMRDFNKMRTTIEDLERKTKHLRLQAYPEDTMSPMHATDGSEKSLRDQIDRKDRLIADLQKRLTNLNHVTTSKAPLNISVSDMAPPSAVVDNFCNLFEVEWAEAFQALRDAWKDDERATHALFRIVRHAYVFCYDLAEAQRMAVDDTETRLQETMLTPTFTHPVSRQKYKPATEVSAETQRCVEVGRKMLKEYRNIFVPRTIPAVQELFRKIKLPEVFETGQVTHAVLSYVDRLVELLWLMVVQEPPLLVHWLEPRATVQPRHFRCYSEKGDYVRHTMWPAVFLREGGPLLSRGVVMATNDEEWDDRAAEYY